VTRFDEDETQARALEHARVLARDSAEVISGVVAAKTASARKPGRTYFDETWLLI
jgi:hypothetical protein